MNARNIAFYKFIQIEAPQLLCDELKEGLAGLGLKGTVLIAQEGINAMLAGPDEKVLKFEKSLKEDPRFSDVLVKVSFSEKIPFRRLLVKVKEEVLTLGDPEIQPKNEKAPYITPHELKVALDKNEDLTLIDVRNDFEVNHGTFKGAINPKTKSFSQFTDFANSTANSIDKNKKIVTFCTGGIRCEKGALILRRAGFKNVFQLHGGILEYFSKNPGAPHFQGKCFVFDERELLDADLKSTTKN